MSRPFAGGLLSSRLCVSPCYAGAMAPGEVPRGTTWVRKVGTARFIHQQPGELGVGGGWVSLTGQLNTVLGHGLHPLSFPLPWITEN